MSMSLFSRLSDELIIEIAKDIERRYGNTCLAPLVLCSRRLNNVVGPILYRTFTQRSNKLATLPNLLRTVVKKPLLGSEVKKLVLTEVDNLLDLSGYSEPDFTRCWTAIRSFKLSINKKAWMVNLRQGSWDAVVSLSLFFLSSLQEIEISSGWVSSYDYLHQIARHIAHNQCIENPIGHDLSLKNLQRLSFVGMDTRNILLWCAISSIKTVRASMLEEDDGWNIRIPIPGERYRVQDLRIDNSFVDSLLWETLLPFFVSLDSFYYRHSGAIRADDVLTDFLPQRFGDGLAHLHNSLEKLVLLGSESEQIFGHESRKPLGSLAEFTKLRCIGTEAEVLFGPERGIERPQLAIILPASLEILVIRRCEDDIYDDLRELLYHRNDKFKALKAVAIDIPKARAGDLHDVGLDGLHQREEEVKRCLKSLNTDQDTEDANNLLQRLTSELEIIQSNRPTQKDWEAWWTRQPVEQKLIADFKNSGIELRFHLYSGNTWTYMPPFMVY